MRILIIKLSAIGDVVQVLPALEAIHALYPGSRITWVVEEDASGILEEHPYIHKLLISRRKTWMKMLRNPRTCMQGVIGLARFVRELRSVRYDIVIDFQGLLKSGILAGLAKASRKIGFNGTRELSYLFLNERLPASNIEKHALERYLDIVRYLGAKKPSSECLLHIENEIAFMRQRVSSVRRNEPLVVINPVARWQTKLWSEQKFAETADYLVQEKKAVIVFTGSKNDRVVVKRIMAMMKQGAVNWAGETSLKELAALAKLSDVFITTDTGPMHLAAAAGAKVIALFGPTAPWRTGPYGTQHIKLRTGIDCSPCFKRKCEMNVQCMEGIAVADVLAAIQL